MSTTAPVLPEAPAAPTSPFCRLSSHGLVVVRVPRLGWSTRVHARAVLVTAVMIAAGFVVLLWSLAVGDIPVPLGEVIDNLLGQRRIETDYSIRTIRLPRAITGILVGAAFGLSGAVFQRLLRNPLASPDIIGINQGATAAAVYVVVILEGPPSQVTVGALVGALATAIAIYLLAHRRGVSGYRLVLVGIGAAAMLTSASSYLLTQAKVFEARRAMVWIAGSLNGRTWEHARPLAVALVVLVPATIALSRHLRGMDLGDDAAIGLGIRVERCRAGLLLAATALAAVATASAGPIGFAALIAPQIGRRLVGGRTAALVPSMVCGALLVLSADLAGRELFASDIPVGVVTSILGAPFLLYLLSRANRIGSGG